MGLATDLGRFATKTTTNLDAVFVTTVVELRDSIKFGSAVTGAPAMPVAPGRFRRAGALRDSVIATYASPTTAIIYTTLPYALDVEDNAKGHTFANGAPHGWKLTIAGFSRVLQSNTTRIAGYGR